MSDAPKRGRKPKALSEPAIAHSDDPDRDQAFATALLKWFESARREMPWRNSRDPYFIWVSEIMLQQTQVKTATPYFLRFTAAFPTVKALAEAPQDQVLKLWEGLGYYSRARNLQKGAQYVMAHFGGKVPATPEAIREIPGIGPYSAGAILSIAYGVPEPAVDGNVIRVMSRIDAIPTPFDTVPRRRALEQRVRGIIPRDQAGDFNQALMELGALICTPRPDCPACPVRAHCRAYAQGKPEAFPAKVKKTQVRIQTINVALVRHRARDGQDRWLLQQQGDTGLFRGLWCLPWIAQDPPPPGEQPSLPELPVEVRVLGQLATVSHTLTHRQLEMNVQLCQTGTIPQSLPPGWAWVDPDANPDYAIPVAHQKIFNYIKAHPLLLQMYL